MPSPKPRLLIVDDDADWRALLKLALDDLGYDIAEAASGEQALRMMEQETFPIVLLDMNMPGMSGHEVIERMPSPMPRVVLLTSAQAQDVGETLSSGSCYYLPKDAGADALSLILQSLQH